MINPKLIFQDEIFRFKIGKLKFRTLKLRYNGRKKNC